MLFNSIDYLIFLPVVLLVYWLSSHKFQNRFLLAASYFFYGMWDERFLVLIALSTCVDYLAALLLENRLVSRSAYWKATTWLLLSCLFFLTLSWNRSLDVTLSVQGLKLSLLLLAAWFIASIILRIVLTKLSDEQHKKVSLILSVATNLIILGFFKYFNFFVSSAEDVIASMGGNAEFWRLDIILPVGISFYTFQTMSYSIDVYRGHLKPTRNFLDFALYVSFFPQLVAGPIERATNLLPRILKRRHFDIEQAKRGLFLIFWGMFKKVAIADGVSGSVDSIYNTHGSVTSLDIVLATVLFAIQIYCDFSAYTDIARGSSKLLGIELMRNFNLPYFSTNPSEFWRRWHISLSTWLRDYLYISLGGNRKGRLLTYRNLMLTMLLGGLWHGAAWNYVLWGAYQGALLCIHRIFNETIKSAQKETSQLIVKVLKIGFFFIFTCYGWLLFRSNSLDQVVNFTHSLFMGWDSLATTIKRPTFAALLSIPILFIYELAEYSTKDIHFYRQWKPVHGLALAVIILCLEMGLSNPPTQFIYFAF